MQFDADCVRENECLQISSAKEDRRCSQLYKEPAQDKETKKHEKYGTSFETQHKGSLTEPEPTGIQMKTQ